MKESSEFCLTISAASRMPDIAPENGLLSNNL